ncbi:hypothetical protein QQS21_005819 [Conoideocrella luteorostrata]|uniref:Gfd2/YDR514C-like C-terminal domain-containing protein n=1 Tax=Conoideocrella luteorostrata TaxID=1105319 RepID=A0AAJ0FYT1_9HYPO|nr:hypothetical protein QQS21_005819 [Conoideocrella luteorostrata]
MRYHRSPRMFRWRHWEELWRSNLPDLETAKVIAASTIFVAIDTEPWLDDGKNKDNREASEIGIAFLFPTANQKGPAPKPPQTLDETYQRFSISSHCVCIRGRERLTRELFWNQDTENIASIEPDRVEETITNILQTTQQRASSSFGSPLTLTLVGFDLNAEFRILSHQYPRALGCFTSWVDIQELTQEINIVPQAPSLRNTLIAFGYEPKFPTCTSRTDGHSAGNDAMRSICVLVTLLFFAPQGQELARICSRYHAGRAKQREHLRRNKINMKKSDLFAKSYPMPREKYPFRAKVILPGAYFQVRPDPGILCEYFLKYRPVAAGCNRTQEFGGWICLASLEELNAFVEEVHGLEDAESKATWVATSQYDPTVVPATTAAELDEFLKQKSIAEIAEKTRIRQERKETKARDEIIDSY